MYRNFILKTIRVISRNMIVQLPDRSLNGATFFNDIKKKTGENI